MSILHITGQVKISYNKKKKKEETERRLSSMILKHLSYERTSFCCCVNLSSRCCWLQGEEDDINKSNHGDIFTRKQNCYLRNQITIFISHTGLENTRPLVRLEVKIDIGLKKKGSAERNRQYSIQRMNC